MINFLNPFTWFSGKFGFRAIKSLIDNFHRMKVVPIEGSVLYSDLMLVAEHSGIYVGNREISNVKVQNLLLGKSKILISIPEDFTEKAWRGKNIYVSSNKDGAVGNWNVSEYALSRVGNKRYYNPFFKNCHTFCMRCLDECDEKANIGFLEKVSDFFGFGKMFDETWERTITALKRKAKQKLGATKWYVWDLEEEEDSNMEDYKYNMKELYQDYENIPLNTKNIINMELEGLEIENYIKEISDENIPEYLMSDLNKVKEEVNNINNDIRGKYKNFLKEFSDFSEENKNGTGYTYSQLKKLPENFSEIIEEMKINDEIKKVLDTLGKSDNLDEVEVSKKKEINEMSQDELFGIYKSNDITRILPSELILFENEDLENLFYAKMYENSLLTYELQGESKRKTEEDDIEYKKGPIIACLDTSGSMNGTPLKKARALLLAISKILKKEDRKLYIILFGSVGEILELNIENSENNIEVFNFLNQNFNGGTDFDTPLKRAVEIIEEVKYYNKADILFISDGICELSNSGKEFLKNKKEVHSFKICTVNCSNIIFLNDGFSDKIIKI